MNRRPPEGVVLCAGLGALALFTLVYSRWMHVTNATTVSLTFLMIVLLVATLARLRTAVAMSLAAMLSFNFFFLPPVGTFAISDLHNWVSLFAFLTVSLVASNLSATARERTQEALQRQADLLEERKSAELSRQRDELKSMLLASLAHDLRTPLTAMRVAASNLQQTWLNDSERRVQSDIVLTEIERLTRLFQNILEMARIDAGAKSGEVRWVHPSEILAAAREHVEQTIRQHTLTERIDPDRPIEVDPRAIATAIAYVLENAAQYSPPGAAIGVEMTVDAGGLTVRVRDRGPGVPVADLPHIFDRFYRGAAAKARASGTGMGLAIARGLLAAAGGRIAAANDPQGGAVFTIVVPARSRDAGTGDDA